MTSTGLTTKRDQTGLGTVCAAGLVGVVILIVINIFIGSRILSWVVTIVALPIFLGLTVYEEALEGDSRAACTIAIISAVRLYLNFLNIFLILLRIMDFFGGEN